MVCVTNFESFSKDNSIPSTLIGGEQGHRLFHFKLNLETFIV